MSAGFASASADVGRDCGEPQYLCSTGSVLPDRSRDCGADQPKKQSVFRLSDENACADGFRAVGPGVLDPVGPIVLHEEVPSFGAVLAGVNQTST